MALPQLSAITATSLEELVEQLERQRKELEYVLGSVESDNIVRQSITTEVIRDQAINSAKIELLSVNTGHIKDLSVETAKIQDGAIVNAKIANLAVTTAKITDAAITNAKIDRASVDKLQVVSADIVDASITNAKIADLAVTTAKIADATISTAKIANLAVNSAKISDAAITNAKLDRASVNKIVIGTADIDSAAITNAKIADASISTAKIQTGAITNVLIGTAAVDTAQLADASITDAKVVSMTANKLTAGTIDASKINVTNLVADNIVTGTITLASANLLRNTDFRTGDFTYWTRAEPEWSVDTLTKYDISNTAKVNVSGLTADAWKAIYSNWVETTAEKTFTASVYTMTDDVLTIDQSAYFEFEWFDSAGARISVSSIVVKPSINNVWEYFKLTATSPLNTVKMRWRVHPVRNGRFWVARPIVQKGKLSTEWQPHTNELLADKGITNLQIGDSAVDNRVITAATITGDKLVADAITAREIAAATITANEMVVGTITAASGIIADAAITTAKIANAAITDAKIHSLDATKITTGTLDAGRVRVGSTSTFDANYDPTTKETPSGAQSKVDSISSVAHITTNSLFSKWGGTYPDGWGIWSGVGATKETTTTRESKFAARFNVGLDADGGLDTDAGQGGTLSKIALYDYLVVEMDFMLVSGGTNGAGLIVDWYGTNSAGTSVYDRETVSITSASPTTGKWHTIRRVIKRPTTNVINISGMRLYLMANWSGFGTRDAKDIIYDRVVVREATADEITAYNSPTDAQNKANTAESNSKSYTNKIAGMKVRYIRDWLHHSTANLYNHWVEIQALAGTTNRALNKTVTGSHPESDGTTDWSQVTDGDTATANYVGTGASPGLGWVRIDLGAVYDDIDTIKVWHYYGDGRTYHKTRTQISEDGSNWIDVFDSAVSGEYAETSAGNVIETTSNSGLKNNQKFTDLWRYSNTTYIDGGNIYANTVTANQINVTSLSAITADLGTVTAGTISGVNISASVFDAKDTSLNVQTIIDNHGISQYDLAYGDGRQVYVKIHNGHTQTFRYWDGSGSYQINRLSGGSDGLTVTGTKPFVAATGLVTRDTINNTPYLSFTGGNGEFARLSADANGIYATGATIRNVKLLPNAVDDGSSIGNQDDVLAYANHQYTVSQSGHTSSTAMNVFRPHNDYGYWGSVSTATSPIVYDINFGTNVHYWTDLAIIFRYGRYAKTVKVESYEGTTKAWKTIYNTTTNSERTIVVPFGSNYVSQLKFTFDVAATSHDDIRIERISGFSRSRIGNTWLPKDGGTLYGGIQMDGNLHMRGTSPTIRFEDTDLTGAGKNWWLHVNSGRLYFLRDADGDGTWDSPHNYFESNGRLHLANGMTVTGNLDLHGDMRVVKNNTLANTAYNNNNIELYTSDGSPAILGFHRGGYTGLALYHDADKSLRIRTAGGMDVPVWHGGNKRVGQLKVDYVATTILDNYVAHGLGVVPSGISLTIVWKTGSVSTTYTDVVYTEAVDATQFRVLIKDPGGRFVSTDVAYVYWEATA